MTTDIAQPDFPQPPIEATRFLIPISSWAEMYQESQITKVAFDLFWFESVTEGVAYFFRWLGDPRSTILVVWNDDGPTHIECRKIGDVLVTEIESMPMVAEIERLFRMIRLNRDNLDH